MAKYSKIAAEVFAIPELLEMILACLPARDILRAQAVNRHFRDNIRGSKRLQRLLFLEPATSSSSSEAFSEGLNTLVLEKVAGLPAFDFRVCHPDCVFNSKLGIEQVDFPSGLDLAVSSSSSAVNIVSSFNEEFLCRTLLDGYAPTQRTANWRHMLVRQPATLPIHVALRLPTLDARFDHLVYLNRTGHLCKETFSPTTTFGDIMNWIEARFLQNHRYGGVVAEPLQQIRSLLDWVKVEELLDIVKREKGHLALKAWQVFHKMVCSAHRESFDQHKSRWTGRRYSAGEVLSLMGVRRHLEWVMDQGTMSKD